MKPVLAVTVLLALATAGVAHTEAAPPPPVSTSAYSDCVLSEIAKLEGTTSDKLTAFSKASARKSISACQPAKGIWATALDRQFAADPKYADARLRKAQVNQVVSTDEMAVMLMINLKAR